jgi:RimJ/RimL family protein N-acetyltransferase
MDIPTRVEVVPGERIYLSHPLQTDVPLFARWFADVELTTYLGQPGKSYTLEQEQRWFESLKDHDAPLFAIVAREGDRIVGSISFKDVDHRHGTAELGIAIGEKEAWGRGYGSEAVGLLADYGLTFLGLHTVYLWFVEFNERGRRAYLKAGFKEAGRIRGAYLLDGRRYDRVLMDCTREDLGPSKLVGMIGQIPRSPDP